MNRRSFFTKLGLAAATLAILPTATTYARKWVAPTAQCPMWIPNPEWVSAEFELSLFNMDYGWSVITPEFLQAQKLKDEASAIQQPVSYFSKP